jgi:hypothetical protein
MKLAAISMIRDEADLIGTFLSHLAALFDLVFLLDQRSSDGTSEVIQHACRQRPGWSHWHMDFAGRHQKEVTTLFMGRAFEVGADAVFFLDCDEFIDVRNRADLDAIAARMLERAKYGFFTWKACVPLRLDRWPFNPRDKVWIAGKDTPVEKVAVPRTLFAAAPGLRIGQGSHRVHDPAGKVLRGGVPVGSLLHIPVRSRHQFLQKVFTSAFANLAKNNPMTHESVHKRNFLEVIAGRELSDMTLASIGAQFPMRHAPPQWWTKTRELKLAGFTKTRLGIPFAELALPTPPRPDVTRIVARCLLEFRLEDIAAGEGSLVLEGNTVRFQPAGA